MWHDIPPWRPQDSCLLGSILDGCQHQGVAQLHSRTTTHSWTNYQIPTGSSQVETLKISLRGLFKMQLLATFPTALVQQFLKPLHVPALTSPKPSKSRGIKRNIPGGRPKLRFLKIQSTGLEVRKWNCHKIIAINITKTTATTTRANANMMFVMWNMTFRALYGDYFS